MNIPAWIDTSNAEATFVIANTPNFLVRKFKQESAARALSKSLSGKKLLDSYRAAVVVEPENLRQLVTPYLLLSAMYLKQSIPELRDAATFPALPNYKWIATFRQILEDTFSPTEIVKFELPNFVVPSATTSSYPAAVSMFKVDRS
jgi:hypothetical protein